MIKATYPKSIDIMEGQKTTFTITMEYPASEWQSLSYYRVLNTAGEKDFTIKFGDSYTQDKGNTKVINLAVTVEALLDNIREGKEVGYFQIEAFGNKFTKNTDSLFVDINVIDINRTSGGSGNDVLRGFGSGDRLTGFSGNDTYYVQKGDTVIEAVNGGNDTVFSAISWKLGPNIENLNLTGTANINGIGNDLANKIVGNAGNNVLIGNGGADTLVGWAGDDIYETDGRDTLIEQADGGTDTVRSSVNFTLAEHFENLVLTGNANLWATGNAADNRIVGNAGNNVLIGRGGRDTMSGGAGNDYYVTDGNDAILESADGGIDSVRAFADFVMGSYVENLQLGGAVGYSAAGNFSDNTIIGNAGANRISGGAGNDTIYGGGGADIIHGGQGADVLSGGADGVLDVFLFNSIKEVGLGALADTITDFHRGSDLINLRAMDADLQTSGNQALKFGGVTATANGLWYVQSGKDLYLRGDVTGDRIADFEIKLVGVSSLSTDDLIL